MIVTPNTDIKILHNGKPRSARAVEAVSLVEKLEKLKQKHGTDPWPVIEEILEIWSKQHPGEYKSFLWNLEEVRETRRDPIYGTSQTGSMRYTLDIPQRVMYMVRAIYSDEELPMNKPFFHEWARRFKKMKIAEKG